MHVRRRDGCAAPHVICAVNLAPIPKLNTNPITPEHLKPSWLTCTWPARYWNTHCRCCLLSTATTQHLSDN
jgi:hypothetical protein